MDTLNLTLKIGDVLKIGKFKNRTAVIKDFGVDAHGQPTVITDKGEINVFKFRLVTETKSSLNDKRVNMKHIIQAIHKIHANKDMLKVFEGMIDDDYLKENAKNPNAIWNYADNIGINLSDVQTKFIQKKLQEYISKGTKGESNNYYHWYEKPILEFK